MSWSSFEITSIIDLWEGPVFLFSFSCSCVLGFLCENEQNQVVNCACVNKKPAAHFCVWFSVSVSFLDRLERLLSVIMCFYSWDFWQQKMLSDSSLIPLWSCLCGCASMHVHVSTRTFLSQVGIMSSSLWVYFYLLDNWAGFRESTRGVCLWNIVGLALLGDQASMFHILIKPDKC